MRLPLLLCVFGLLAVGCGGGSSSTAPSATPVATNDSTGRKEKDNPPKDGAAPAKDAQLKERSEAENKAKEELEKKWHLAKDKIKTGPKEEGEPVVGLNLGSIAVTDADLAILKAFTHLQELDLLNTKVTDAGLAQLKGLPLETLVLSHTEITGAGLDQLKGMAKLKVLSLSSLKLKESDFAVLQSLPQLQSLFLNDTGIGDAGLANLRGVKQSSVFPWATQRSPTPACQASLR
jgi:hypothetical protein